LNNLNLSPGGPIELNFYSCSASFEKAGADFGKLLCNNLENAVIDTCVSYLNSLRPEKREVKNNTALPEQKSIIEILLDLIYKIIKSIFRI